MVFSVRPYILPFKAPHALKVIACGLTLGACGQSLSSFTTPALNFQHLSPLVLNVDKVQIVNAYEAKSGNYHMERNMLQSPAAALEAWAKRRLQPSLNTDNAATARFIIEQASFREIPQETNADTRAFFTDEQAYTLHVVLKARLEITAPQYGKSVYANTERTIGIRETATLNTYKLQRFELLKAGMDDFDARMTQNIQTWLARWIE